MSLVDNLAVADGRISRQIFVRRKNSSRSVLCIAKFYFEQAVGGRPPWYAPAQACKWWRDIGLSHRRPNFGISGDLLSENEAKHVVIWCSGGGCYRLVHTVIIFADVNWWRGCSSWSKSRLDCLEQRCWLFPSLKPV